MKGNNCDPRLDEMRDPVDCAGLEAEAYNEEALRARERPPEPVDPATLRPEDFECAHPDCEEDVPVPRRHAGYTLCIDCAEREQRGLEW